jgi:HEAT repeat protein
MKRILIRKGMQVLALVVAVTVCWPALAAVDQASLDRAFERLAGYDYGDDYTELAAIERAVHGSLQNESQRAALERRLVSVLSGGAPNAAKDYACRALALIGGAESVAALAALLPDPELSGLARYALERIPDPAVDRALRGALGQTSGRLQAGVINSIGIRRDREAVQALSGLLKREDPVVVEAALLALGKIATRESARMIGQFRVQGSAEARATAEAAYLEAADLLLEGGDAEAAAMIFESLYRDHEGGAFHLAGFQGLVAARPAEANRRLLAALSADDLPVRNLAARLVAELPGETPQEYFVALTRLPSDAQVALLGALRLRADKAARPVVLPLLESQELTVRVATIEALGAVGGPGDVGLLARIAASGTPVEREAARNSLTQLPGETMNQSILAAMADAEPAARVELLRSLIGRVARETMPAVARHLADPDGRVSRAAAEVLSAMGDEGQVQALVTFVVRGTTESQREAGVRALTSIAGRVRDGATDALLAGLREAQPEARAALLRVLPVIGGRTLDVVRRGVQDSDEIVRDASVRALTNWREAEARPDLLGIIRTAENPSHRVLAFRGYVRLGRELDLSAADRFAWFEDAAGLARTAEDKRLVIAALGEIPTVEALQLAAKYLDDAELANEAGAAIVKIAPGLGANGRSTAVEVLKRVISTVSAQPIKDDAQRALGRLEGAGSR